MSTKNLARTVIEGGRHNGNKYDRRNSSAVERVHARQYCKQVTLDPELADEDVIEERQPIYKGFTDKLAPMYRWLDAQVGRPWSEVRSEVFTNFDTRTTAGRHITFDHLLREVVDTESGFDAYGRIADPEIPKEESSTGRYSYWSVRDYYVDREGIFCKTPDRPYPWSPPIQLQEDECKEVANWLNGRMIKEIDNKYYWLMPISGIWKCEWVNKPQDLWSGYRFNPEFKYLLLQNGEFEKTNTGTIAGKPYSFKTKTHGDYWEPIESPFSFRQRGERLPEDLKYFKSLNSRIQEDILSFTKDR